MTDPLHPLINTLLVAGIKSHARNLRYDREGYSGPAWYKSKSCSGLPAVCAKWKSKEWREPGSNCNHVEWYGRIDDSIECDCGADIHNKQLNAAAKELNERLNSQSTQPE